MEGIIFWRAPAIAATTSNFFGPTTTGELGRFPSGTWKPLREENRTRPRLCTVHSSAPQALDTSRILTLRYRRTHQLSLAQGMCRPSSCASSRWRRESDLRWSRRRTGRSSWPIDSVSLAGCCAVGRAKCESCGLTRTGTCIVLEAHSVHVMMATTARHTFEVHSNSRVQREFIVPGKMFGSLQASVFPRELEACSLSPVLDLVGWSATIASICVYRRRRSTDNIGGFK